MKLNPGDIRKFRKFHEYVSVRIPQVQNMPVIIRALKKYSGNPSDKKIKDALAWNRGPTVVIVPDLMCGGERASGCYTDGVNAIEIDEEDVQDFEDGNGLKHTESGKLVYYVGVTLLHELCHWANDGTGAADLTHEEFEQALYGKVIEASDD